MFEKLRSSNISYVMQLVTCSLNDDYITIYQVVK